MKPEVKRDLTDSARDFVEKVWPVIADRCGGGELVPVEAVTASPFAKLLDDYSGIDHWQIIHENGQIRGIASRVQWGNDWQTFTIRIARPSGYLTEYQKRMATLTHKDEGWVFPPLTSQAYLDQRGGNLLSVAVIYTEDLYSLDLDLWPSRWTESGEEFKYIAWDSLLKRNLRMYVWSPKKRQLPLEMQ